MEQKLASAMPSDIRPAIPTYPHVKARYLVELTERMAIEP
jgi:hypothetical protein